MALKARGVSAGVEPIDPTAEPALHEIEPMAPRPVDPSKLAIGFDRDSDTLMVFLLGRRRPAIVVGDEGPVFLLVDPKTTETTGFQIEGFLSRVANLNPAAIDLLEHAELRGITPFEVRMIRWQLGLPVRPGAAIVALEGLVGRHVPGGSLPLSG